MSTKFDELEKEFDTIYDLKTLIKKSICDIKEIRLDEKCCIYEDSNAEEIKDIKNAEIKYFGKEIFINCEGGFPKFLLKFVLEGKLNNYMYELEFNLDGEFSDEYFQVLEGEEAYD